MVEESNPSLPEPVGCSSDFFFPKPRIEAPAATAPMDDVIALPDATTAVAPID